MQLTLLDRCRTLTLWTLTSRFYSARPAGKRTRSGLVSFPHCVPVQLLVFPSLGCSLVDGRFASMWHFPGVICTLAPGGTFNCCVLSTFQSPLLGLSLCPRDPRETTALYHRTSNGVWCANRMLTISYRMQHFSSLASNERNNKSNHDIQLIVKHNFYRLGGGNRV